MASAESWLAHEAHASALPATRVLVAMSGGVDSAVAAARLKAAGCDVVGVTLHLWDYPPATTEKGRCCAPEDQYDAKWTAEQIGIPHFSFDRRELFRDKVVNPFIDAYLEGRTPSPCVTCNRSVKMRELLPLADRLGAAFVATGHYARVAYDDAGKARLFRGRDPVKDQSYFLHMLRADELSRVVFPLGNAIKSEIREEALALGLCVAEKGDSQELCFVPNGNYAGFVEAHAKERLRPGPIVDASGRVVGQHGGVHQFTRGQRKGLGVALGNPAFVNGIDAATGSVRIGDESTLLAPSADFVDADWADDVSFPLEAAVKIRARTEPVPARIERHPDAADTYRAHFRDPVRAVSPGQMAVVYREDRVLGGGLLI